MRIIFQRLLNLNSINEKLRNPKFLSHQRERRDQRFYNCDWVFSFIFSLWQLNTRKALSASSYNPEIILPLIEFFFSPGWSVNTKALSPSLPIIVIIRLNENARLVKVKTAIYFNIIKVEQDKIWDRLCHSYLELLYLNSIGYSQDHFQKIQIFKSILTI